MRQFDENELKFIKKKNMAQEQQKMFYLEEQKNQDLQKMNYLKDIMKIQEKSFLK